MQLPTNNIPYKNLQNKLLLADPSLTDGVFDRTVIYLVDHQPDTPTVGFILNKPTGMNVGKLVYTDELAPLRHLPVYYGGPCEDTQLMFLSYHWTPGGTLKCKTRVDSDEAIRISKKPNTDLRAYIGHSAWTIDQLKQELEYNAWITTTPSQKIFQKSTHHTLWQNSLQPISPAHRILSLTPKSPEQN